MFIRPTPEELANFGEPDILIFNSGKSHLKLYSRISQLIYDCLCNQHELRSYSFPGQFPASTHAPGVESRASIDLHVGRRELVILGSEYAGEMKKGVLSMLMYLLPMRGILTLHSRYDSSVCTIVEQFKIVIAFFMSFCFSVCL
jgi:phosphoenolpyruvate carboxykinase (ATP)